MTSGSLQKWTSRVLDRGRLGIAPDENWKLVAYEQYKDKLCAPDYPCFFGQAGEGRGEMLYTFTADGRLEELVTNMRQFVSLIGTPGYERSSLVAFFEPIRASWTTFPSSLVFGRYCSFCTTTTVTRPWIGCPIIHSGNSHSGAARCSSLERHLRISGAAAGILARASCLSSSPGRSLSIQRRRYRSRRPYGTAFTNACGPTMGCRCIQTSDFMETRPTASGSSTHSLTITSRNMEPVHFRRA
jgi:hypothetical protein